MILVFAAGGFSVRRRYLRAFESIISFSKSLRSDLNTFFDGILVLSAISCIVSSIPIGFSAFMICSSFLLSFTVSRLLVYVCLFIVDEGVFLFCGVISA